MKKILVCLGMVAVALSAACGPGASSTKPTPASSAQQPIEVQINMTEFKIEPSMTSFKVGVPYRLVVSNKGTVNHDFSISSPVMGGMAGMDAEHAHANALAVIDANDMPPGATKTIDLTFSKPYSASEMEFACHTPGHYEAGMQLPITVTQ